MILYINTSKGDKIEIALKNKADFIDKKIFQARRRQAEKLLPAIDLMLKKNKSKLKDLKKIEVKNEGESFTALRIGVITANALGYALGVPVTEQRTGNIEQRTGNIKHRIQNREQGTQSREHKTQNIEQGGKFNIVEPKYNREPDITQKKSK